MAIGARYSKVQPRIRETSSALNCSTTSSCKETAIFLQPCESGWSRCSRPAKVQRCNHCLAKQGSLPSLWFPITFLPQKSCIFYSLSVAVPKTAIGDDRGIEPSMLTMPAAVCFLPLSQPKPFEVYPLFSPDTSNPVKHHS